MRDYGLCQGVEQNDRVSSELCCEIKTKPHWKRVDYLHHRAAKSWTSILRRVHKFHEAKLFCLNRILT